MTDAVRGLGRFAGETLGEHARVRSLRETKRSTLVEVTTADRRRFIAKQFGGLREYDAEVLAHAAYVPAIQHLAPTLLAADRDERMVLMTAVPGRRPVRPGPGLCRQAGRLLRAFHDSVPGGTASVGARVQEQLERQVATCRAHGIDVDQAWLARQVAVVDGLGPLPLVPSHGDFSPRNWLVDGEGTLRVIDFENTQVHAVGYDLSRVMFRLTGARPARRAAFYAGYGRPLDWREQVFAEVQLALHAVGMLIWATRRGAPAMTEHCHKVLRTLRVDDVRRPLAVA